jgi:hypothetical protein
MYLYHFNEKKPAGTKGTAGFVAHREIYGSVCTRTRHGYGVRRYGCGVGKPDLRVTRIKPYVP